MEIVKTKKEGKQILIQNVTKFEARNCDKDRTSEFLQVPIDTYKILKFFCSKSRIIISDKGKNQHFPKSISRVKVLGQMRTPPHFAPTPSSPNKKMASLPLKKKENVDYYFFNAGKTTSLVGTLFLWN